MSDSLDHDDPRADGATSEGPPKPIVESVEEAASGKLGVRSWDRPRIYRETAAAATDADLAYWLALILSGAIATLGLAIDSSAVVIGAMLVAPLLAPVLGLAMALAVGDGRLAIQAGAVVAASTLAVLVTGALLTMALPFQTITLEISQRTRPTTLDLAIAVFSGLAGAVVTVATGKRLSAVIPGVAVAVALIPPLGVAGFGMGAGWNLRLIHGALLLYGANLGGIVLSGMFVFLLVGLQRPEVIEETERWHARGEATGLAAWVTRFRWYRLAGTMVSPRKRMALVLAFVIAVAVPLSGTLGQLARERRVRDAVEVAAEMFSIPGRSSIVSRQVVLGDGRAQVYLRLATAERFGAADQEEFDRRASASAGEPVTVILEQLMTSRGEVDLVAELPPPIREEAAVREPTPEESVERVRDWVRAAAAELPLPPGTRLAGVELTLNDTGGSALVGTLSEAPLPEEAGSILEALLERELAAARISVRTEHVPASARRLDGSEEAAEAVRRAGDLLQRYPLLRVELLAGDSAPEATLEALETDLRDRIGDDSRIRTVRDQPEAGIHLRLRATEPE